MKRIVMLIIALAMIAVMTSCGKDGEAGETRIVTVAVTDDKGNAVTDANGNTVYQDAIEAIDQNKHNDGSTDAPETQTTPADNQNENNETKKPAATTAPPKTASGGKPSGGTAGNSSGSTATTAPKNPSGSAPEETQPYNDTLTDGAGWPNNEFTKDLPKPGFITDNAWHVGAGRSNISIEINQPSDGSLSELIAEMIEYAHLLTQQGFTETKNIVDEHEGKYTDFDFEASKGSIHIRIGIMGGYGGIDISKA